MTDTYQKLFQSLLRSPINHCYHCRKENVSVDPRSLISIAHLFKTQLRSRLAEEVDDAAAGGNMKRLNEPPRNCLASMGTQRHQ